MAIRRLLICGKMIVNGCGLDFVVAGTGGVFVGVDSVWADRGEGEGDRSAEGGKRKYRGYKFGKIAGGEIFCAGVCSRSAQGSGANVRGGVGDRISRE